MLASSRQTEDNSLQVAVWNTAISYNKTKELLNTLLTLSIQVIEFAPCYNTVECSIKSTISRHLEIEGYVRNVEELNLLFISEMTISLSSNPETKDQVLFDMIFVLFGQ